MGRDVAAVLATKTIPRGILFIAEIVLLEVFYSQPPVCFQPLTCGRAGVGAGINSTKVRPVHRA